MKITLVILIVLLSGISACQSVPAERKNNCACNWELMEGNKTGDVA